MFAVVAGLTGVVDVPSQGSHPPYTGKNATDARGARRKSLPGRRGHLGAGARAQGQAADPPGMACGWQGPTAHEVFRLKASPQWRRSTGIRLVSRTGPTAPKRSSLEPTRSTVPSAESHPDPITDEVERNALGFGTDVVHVFEVLMERN